MIKIHKVEQNTPEWDELHKGRWTGSTAIKLLQGKQLPKWGGFEGNKYTKRGKVLEHIAIREYTRETGVKPSIVGFVTNSKYINAGCSPDAIAGDTLIEVKCLNGEKHERLISGEIPLEYMAQIQFGMVICDLKKAQLLAFNPEYEKQLTIIDINYDPEIADNIRVKLAIDLHGMIK